MPPKCEHQATAAVKWSRLWDKLLATEQPGNGNTLSSDQLLRAEAGAGGGRRGTNVDNTPGT